MMIEMFCNVTDLRTGVHLGLITRLSVIFVMASRSVPADVAGLYSSGVLARHGRFGSLPPYIVGRYGRRLRLPRNSLHNVMNDYYNSNDGYVAGVGGRDPSDLPLQYYRGVREVGSVRSADRGREIDEVEKVKSVGRRGISEVESVKSLGVGRYGEPTVINDNSVRVFSPDLSKSVERYERVLSSPVDPRVNRIETVCSSDSGQRDCLHYPETQTTFVDPYVAAYASPIDSDSLREDETLSAIASRGNDEVMRGILTAEKNADVGNDPISVGPDALRDAVMNKEIEKNRKKLNDAMMMENNGPESTKMILREILRGSNLGKKAAMRVKQSTLSVSPFPRLDENKNEKVGSANTIVVHDGTVLYPGDAKRDMMNENLDVSRLEEHINHGERDDLPLWSKYYSANIMNAKIPLARHKPGYVVNTIRDDAGSLDVGHANMVDVKKSDVVVPDDVKTPNSKSMTIWDYVSSHSPDRYFGKGDIGAKAPDNADIYDLLPISDNSQVSIDKNGAHHVLGVKSSLSAPINLDLDNARLISETEMKKADEAENNDSDDVSSTIKDGEKIIKKCSEPGSGMTFKQCMKGELAVNRYNIEDKARIAFKNFMAKVSGIPEKFSDLLQEYGIDRQGISQKPEFKKMKSKLLTLFGGENAEAAFSALLRAVRSAVKKMTIAKKKEEEMENLIKESELSRREGSSDKSDATFKSSATNSKSSKAPVDGTKEGGNSYVSAGAGQALKFSSQTSTANQSGAMGSNAIKRSRVFSGAMQRKGLGGVGSANSNSSTSKSSSSNLDESDASRRGFKEYNRGTNVLDMFDQLGDDAFNRPKSGIKNDQPGQASQTGGNGRKDISLLVRTGPSSTLGTSPMSVPTAPTQNMPVQPANQSAPVLANPNGAAAAPQPAQAPSRLANLHGKRRGRLMMM